MPFIVSERDLWGRKWRIQIRDLIVDQLRCVFRVKKTLSATPNTCELVIYNLSPSQRTEIQGPIKRKPTDKPLEKVLTEARPANFVRIEAGYEAKMSSIYFGEVLDGQTVAEGVDVKTRVSSGDGETDMAQRRINRFVGPGTTPSQALNMLAAALGVGRGNLSEVATVLDTSNVAKIFETGTVFTGSAWDELQGIARSANLEISIQDGKLLCLNRGKALAKTSFLLNAGSGLVGSPSVDKTGTVSLKTVMLPDLTPGVPVTLDSKTIKGAYKLTECEYVGDTHGPDWHIMSKAKPL